MPGAHNDTQARLDGPTGDILVVDDEASNLKMFKAILTQEGYAVTTVEDGVRALAFLKRQKFDVVISDINMPQIDGIQLVKIVHEVDPSMRIILITGYPTVDSALDALRIGVYDYLVKPISVKQVKHVVNKAMDSKRLDEENRMYRERLNELVEERTQKLKETEQQLANLFDRVPIGLYRTGVDGTKMEANDAFVRILGYPDVTSYLKAPVLGEYVSEEDHTRWKQLLEQHGIVSNYIVQQRRIDGSVIWVQENARAIRDENGNTLYYEGSIEDITEYKLARQMIEEQERYYRTLMHSLHEEVMVIGPDHTVLDINDTAMRKRGMHRDGIIGKKCLTVLHGLSGPGNSGELNFCLETVFKTGEHCTLQHSDGESGDRCFYNITLSPMTDENGLITSVISVAHDVTDVHRAQDLLVRNEERFRMIFDRSPLGEAIISLDMRLMRVNPSLCSLFDYDSEALLEFSFMELMHERDRDTNERNVKDLIAGKKQELNIVARFQKKTGDDVWARVRLCMIQGESEDIEYLLAQFEDITNQRLAQQNLRRYQKHLKELVEQKTAQLNRTNISLREEIDERTVMGAALRQSEERYRRLFENSSDALFVCDSLGMLQEVNKRAGEMMATDRTQLLERSIFDLFPRETVQTVRSYVTGLREDGVLEMEAKIERADGAYIDVEISARKVMASDDSFQLVLRDITERKNAERELRRRLMSFILEEGKVYLTQKGTLSIALEGFKELLGVGYQGLVFSRTPHEEFLVSCEGDFTYKWLAERGDAESQSPELKRSKEDPECAAKDSDPH